MFANCSACVFERYCLLTWPFYTSSTWLVRHGVGSVFPLGHPPTFSLLLKIYSAEVPSEQVELKIWQEQDFRPDININHENLFFTRNPPLLNLTTTLFIYIVFKKWQHYPHCDLMRWNSEGARSNGLFTGFKQQREMGFNFAPWVFVTMAENGGFFFFLTLFYLFTC